MDLLKDLLHFLMMFFGATIRMESLNYPNILMLTNRVALTLLLIYLMI
tara:strand:- start:141 stop:284 length:144 start_codon:yes stop_codon:yes gene_type:complete